MLRDIQYPGSLRYKSKTEYDPRLFFLEHFYHGKSLRFHLGFFSTKVFKAIPEGFAHFIKNGGHIELIINHFLTKQDKKFLSQKNNIDFSNDLDEVDMIKFLFDSLDQEGLHFEKCLSYLIQKEKLKIKIIKPKLGNGYEHTKEGVFGDGEDEVYFSGSANFTASALLSNSENINADPNWLGVERQCKVKEFVDQFDEIWKGDNEKYDYLSPNETEEISSHIKLKYPKIEIDELLKESLILGNEPSESSRVKKLQRELKFEIKGDLGLPRFPFPEGPRDYQKEAYECWVNNNRKGLFAMATGTGKTITALNCIVEDYKINNFYKFIVLVPTISLAIQWEKEISKKFNFSDVTTCSSQNSKWEDDVRRYGRSVRFGTDIDFCILLTYATFRGSRFQNIFNDLFSNAFDKITIIADEAHTLGSPELLKILPQGINNRIGLSATPERQYDEEGELQLCKFFDAYFPLYTFSYNMKKAIDDKVLCKYFYYPLIVELEPEELIDYRLISKKLNKFLDRATGRYKDDPYVNMLLINRKNIIHKANQKSNCLVKIVDKIGKDNFKYAFIYVPEGYEPTYEDSDFDEDNEDDNSIIDSYTNLLYNKYNFKLRKFTGETKKREEILSQFGEGKLDALLAMKCLDEGVDIPQTKYAIFCSSTGNPRQYIQRRGRVLRYHGNKECAHIYDMIVKPSVEVTNTDPDQIKIEKNIFLSELHRLVNFAVLSENKIDCLNGLEELSSSFGIDIYELANIEDEKYNI
jgi:superfamily II DNA or RNA helicase